MKEQVRRLFLPTGIIFAVILCLAYITLPAKIKVSVSYQDEKDRSAYLVQENALSELESMQFFGNRFVVTIPTEQLSETDSFMIKYDGLQQGDFVERCRVRMALGNYVFYEAFMREDAVFGYHDIRLDDQGKQQITGTLPYVLIYHIGELFEGHRMPIAIKHFCLWLSVGILAAACLFCYKRGSVLCYKKKGFPVRFFKETLVLGSMIAAGFLLGCGVWLLNEKIGLFQSIQKAELYCLFSVLGIITYFVYKRCRKISYTCLTIAAIGICLFFSVSESITFLTADERGAIREQAKILEDPLRHWYMGTAWSNYAILGTFWRIFDWQAMETFFNLDYTQIGKLLHWIAGNLLILVLCELVQNRILDKEDSLPKLQTAFNYVILYMVTLLNPVITMAFKSYNYDLFSMLFGALGAVYAFLAIRDKEYETALKGIVLAFFGGIEKKIAIPIILIADAALVFVVLWNARGRKTRFLKGYAAAVGTMGIHILLTELVYRYVCEVLKKGLSPIVTLREIIDIAMNRFAPLPEIMYRNIDGYIVSRICFILFMGGIIFLAAFVLDWMHVYGKQEKHQVMIRRIEHVMQMSIAVFVLLGVLAAFAGVDYVESKGIYLFYILKNYVMSIPTVVFVLLVISMIKIWNQNGYFSILASMLFVTWGVVPFYIMEMRWNPAWTRYLNLFLLLYSLVIISVSVPELYRYCSKKKMLSACAIGCLIFHICEASESMPGFTYFAPYWYTATSYADKDKEMAVYWGENKASLGNLVLAYCQEQGIDIESQPISIHYGYVRGTWQTVPDNVKAFERDWNSNIELCGTTDFDFYAFDTQGIQRKMVDGGWPEGVTPIRTVKYRGYVIARIYQGSQLKEYFATQWKPMTPEAAL